MRKTQLVPGMLTVVVDLGPFEYAVTRLLGVIFMFAFIVVGVFAIASPELLERDEEGPGSY